MPPLARASYKKSGGVLELTESELKWTQDGKPTPALVVPHNRATCSYIHHTLSKTANLPQALFCSKDGAPHVRLKLGLIDDDAGLNFTFTAPQPTAYTDRESFKKELTAIISRNRAAQDLHKPPPLPVPVSTPGPISLPPSGPSTPNPTPVPTRPAPSRAPSVPTDRRSTPVIQGIDPATDFRLRKKVLVANPDLAALHRELVITGHISESEFWDGREVSSFPPSQLPFFSSLNNTAFAPRSGCS